MKKQKAMVTFEVSTNITFTDAEDLEQQIEDIKIELESIGVDVEAAKYSCDDEDEEELGLEDED